MNSPDASRSKQRSLCSAVENPRHFCRVFRRLGQLHFEVHQLEAEFDLMTTELRYPHLTIDTNGIARIDRTRYKVIHLAGEHYHFGWSAEEILHQHPDLRPEQVYAALTYFYDHHDQLVEEMRVSAETVEAERLKQPLSRAALLKRRSAGNP
jgi:uncharacterized protein (DUF433 family)